MHTQGIVAGWPVRVTTTSRGKGQSSLADRHRTAVREAIDRALDGRCPWERGPVPIPEHRERASHLPILDEYWQELQLIGYQRSAWKVTGIGPSPRHALKPGNPWLSGAPKKAGEDHRPVIPFEGPVRLAGMRSIATGRTTAPRNPGACRMTNVWHRPAPGTPGHADYARTRRRVLSLGASVRLAHALDKVERARLAHNRREVRRAARSTAPDVIREAARLRRLAAATIGHDGAAALSWGDIPRR